MQPICDAISVLGSRHGIMVNPAARRCGLIRYDRWEQLPELHLKAGAVIDGTEYVLPLAPEGEPFPFVDQRLGPCTLSLAGIHPASALKVKLTLATPFRPRDGDYSTTPVLGVKLEASFLEGHFRWNQKELSPESVELFVEWSGPAIETSDAGKAALDLAFTSQRNLPGETHRDGPQEPRALRDRVVGLSGERTGARFRRTVDPVGDDALLLAWCTHDAPALDIKGEMCPYRYARRFADLDAVAAWGAEHGAGIFENAEKVRRIAESHNQSPAVSNLMSLTLHSWLLNTWWVDRGGKDWFSVWEGNCYFHSTVDVEYTQAPFYLALWPELLRIELDFWPEFSKDGTAILGDAGAGTRYLSHDVGACAGVSGQVYQHDMPVEETVNWLILAYAYWRRSGDDSVFRDRPDVLADYLAFVAACDTTGSGVPDRGVANTIDDASPAVQFGREQIYLAVKTLAAYLCGAAMLEALERADLAATYRETADIIRTRILEKGWKDDHYVTLLDPSAEGVTNPWTGEPLRIDEVPGWDSAHIYTVNGQAVLDMVGLDLKLDPARIREDLVVATERCLREYGCVHSDFSAASLTEAEAMAGLAGVSRNPGWISMNMLRDLAAFYRGVDLRPLAERYWNWQTTTNAQEPKIFFETFNGNNLSWYPRGVACWGWFDAWAGLVIDRVAEVDRAAPALGQIRVPRLFDADWTAGTCATIAD